MFTMPKRVPKWAWYVGGGAAGAGLLLKMRNAHTAAPADASQTADGSGAIGYTDAQNMPGIIVAPAQPIASTSGDDGGAMGSLYLGALGDLFSGLQQQNSELLSAVLSTGGGVGGSTDQTGGVVAPPPTTGVSAQTGASTGVVPTTDQTAPPPPPPPSNPCVGMEAGGSAGNCHPAGAICRQMLKCDQNSNGHYCVWKFRFKDGHTNCYNNYSSGPKAGQCVGPYGCP